MLNNVFKVLVSNGIVAIIGLLSSLLLPNLLSIKEYADYQTFILYTSYVALFHLGFPNGLSIKYAGKSFQSINKKQLKAEMKVLLIIISAFSVVFLSWYIVSGKIMVLYIAIMTFCSCYLGAITQLLQAWGVFGLYAVSHIIISAVPLALPLIIYFLVGKASATISIMSYILVYIVMTIFYYVWQIVLGIKIGSARIFSKENLDTEVTGLLFHIGSYINVLFHSADKQIIKWYCSVQEFSYYSFAITMQSTMMIFLTAVSQPLFPYIASGKLDSKEKITFAKRSLLMLGSLSGAAIYICSLVVEHWIPKYVNSLSVIRIYFALFPAMAVINCLYFNYYKVKKMKYRYTIDLMLMFVLAILFDWIAVKIHNGHIGVAIATVAIYYGWLIYGNMVFPQLKLNKQEYVFLVLYLVLFFGTQKIQGNLIGMAIFLVVDFILCVILFNKEGKMGLEYILRRFN